MKKYVVIIFVMTALLMSLSACGSNDEQNAERIPREIVPAGYLSGEINILAVGFPFDWQSIYAPLFREIHPDVVINFETFRFWPPDLARRTALTTRLIADPPDILLFNSGQLVFEKMNVEAVFADLYDFIYGPRGINLDDYFCNIFRATEMDGGLFYMPLYVNFDFATLNKRLFEGIGVDVSEITSLTVSEEIDYFLRMTEAFPDLELLAHESFSIMHVLERMRLYDLDTLEVFVDTPEMYDLFERALQVPINTEFVRFTPDVFENRRAVHDYTGIFLTSAARMPSKVNEMLIRLEFGLVNVAFLFMDINPDLLFTPHPVLLAFGDSRDIGFTGEQSFAIMRNARNGDLAWEFTRFILETEEDFAWEWVFDEELNEYRWDGFRHVIPGRFYEGSRHFPVNRARFENQVGSYLMLQHNRAVNLGGLRQHLTISEFEHRGQTVPPALDFFRTAMESITFEIRNDQAVMQSLIYPDIWLLHSGQQDIATTLSRIQSRLELYVHE